MAGGKVRKEQAVGPIGVFVLRFRAPIGIVLLLFSAFMGYECTRVRIATDFDEFFPRTHPNVQLYENWKRYGGAQTLAMMVQVKHGDIFNFRYPAADPGHPARRRQAARRGPQRGPLAGLLPGELRGGGARLAHHQALHVPRRAHHAGRTSRSLSATFSPTAPASRTWLAPTTRARW